MNLNQWFDCTAALPAPDTEVLVWDGKRIAVDTWGKIFDHLHGGWMDVGDGWASDEQITHWHPLPEPPK